jgi:thiamine biosynthesis lipoprotein
MQVEHRQLNSMGTRLDMVFPDIPRESCNGLVKQIKAELDRIEGMLSIYRPDSELSLLNSHAHAGTIEVSQELFDILGRIMQYHGETRAYFDISMKPVRDFWNDHSGEVENLPEDVRNKTGMSRIILETEGIRYTNQGVFLDLGGFGKGYAIEQILTILEEARVDCGLISFGESLIYGLGSHPYGDSWRVSIPFGDQANPLEFDLKNEALSISGNTLNNQKKFADSGHIVNPVTLQMARLDGLLSVKSRDPVRAEVFSTALFSAGPQASEELIKDIPGIEINWVFT